MAVCAVHATASLLKTLQGSPSFREVSHSSANRLNDLFHACNLTLPELAEVAAAIEDIPFVESDKALVQSGLAVAAQKVHEKPMATNAAARHDKKHQDFTSCWHFLPSEV